MGLCLTWLWSAWVFVLETNRQLVYDQYGIYAYYARMDSVLFVIETVWVIIRVY
jgi:hypothetical protein